MIKFLLIVAQLVMGIGFIGALASGAAMSTGATAIGTPVCGGQCADCGLHRYTAMTINEYAFWGLFVNALCMGVIALGQTIRVMRAESRIVELETRLYGAKQ